MSHGARMKNTREDPTQAQESTYVRVISDCCKGLEGTTQLGQTDSNESCFKHIRISDNNMRMIVAGSYWMEILVRASVVMFKEDTEAHRSITDQDPILSHHRSSVNSHQQRELLQQILFVPIPVVPVVEESVQADSL